MMKEKLVKTFRIFLASSNELKEDREKFAILITRLNKHYHPRGYEIILDIWEFIDPAYNNNRKQDEYNEYIKNCDVFIVLFHTKAGKYTIEELKEARMECETRQLPLFIYFKDLDYWQALQKKDENLTAIKQYIGDDMKHFWGNYSTNDKLHLDFVLWFDNYLFGSKSDIRVENGEVTVGNVAVAEMSQIPFALNNKEYQNLEKRLKQLDEKIEQERNNIQKYPNNPSFPAILSEKLSERNNKQKEFERQQEALLGTARHIVELKKQQVGKKLQKAIVAFETGHLYDANKLLEELENEGEHLMSEIVTKFEQIHEYIEALRLQAQTVMTETEKPIGERINRVEEIYTKADDWANRSAYDKTKFAKLLFEYAYFLNEYAHYDKAVIVYLRQISLSESVYGKNSEETAMTYNNIGGVYHNLAEYNKELEYYFKAQYIFENVLGKQHPNTAVTYDNIGGVYCIQGDYEKALEYLSCALNIRGEVFGTFHSDTASSYNNIGIVYYKMGEYAKSLKYFIIAQAIFEKVLGETNPEIAISYNNIGRVYYDTGNYIRAQEYHQKALTIFEKVLGTEHPKTAIEYNSIGMIYYKMGEYVKALEFCFKAHSILKLVLGSENPDSAMSYNDIGLIYNRLGDYDRALKYHFQALKIREKVWGAEHPDISSSYGNIGLVYKNLGNYNKALEYYFKALDILFKVCGEMYPDTASCYNNIGGIYRNLGRYDLAQEYYRKAITIFENVLGKKHPSTKTVQINIESLKNETKK